MASGQFDLRHPIAHLLPQLLGPLFAPDFGDNVPDPLSGYGRFFQRALAQRFQPVAAFGATAAFAGRIRQPRLHHAFVFQPVERHVNGAQRDGLGPGQFRHLGVDTDAISILAPRQDCSENQLLELAYGIRFCHLSNRV